MSFTPVLLYLCPCCGDLVRQDPVPGEHDGMVCGGPLGHIVIERQLGPADFAGIEDALRAAAKEFE